jgi:AAA domain
MNELMYGPWGPMRAPYPADLTSIFDTESGAPWPPQPQIRYDEWGEAWIVDSISAASSALGVVSSGSPTVSLKNIRHRKWLYGTLLVRGEITVFASPGGVGKSCKALGIAACVATGQRLLGQKIFGENLRVLYINAEDSRVEMLRRLWGLCIEYGITEQDLTGLTILGADDWDTQRISFLRMEKTACLLDQSGIEIFDTLLDRERPDLVIVDPFVSLCAGGSMNDNSAMALVMRAIKRLAAKYDCANLIIHHTRKGGDFSSAEAIGGASAIVNLARCAVMFVPMSAEEAKTLGVLPSQRWRYRKLVSAKANLAPPATEAEWYELRSVTLPNAEPPIYPIGDSVQVIGIAKLPSGGACSGINVPSMEKAILETVDTGKLINGTREPYSPSTAGAANARALKGDAVTAVRNVVGSQMPEEDLSAIVDRIIKDLKSKAVLVEYPISTGRFRKGQGLSVDWSKTPWAEEKEEESTAAADAASETAPEEAQ